MIGAELATLKQSDFKGNRYTGKLDSLSRDGLTSITKSAEVVASGLGISRASVMDAKTVKEHAIPEVAQLAKAGKVSMVKHRNRSRPRAWRKRWPRSLACA
jgi:hypothetical protein